MTSTAVVPYQAMRAAWGNLNRSGATFAPRGLAPSREIHEERVPRISVDDDMSGISGWGKGAAAAAALTGISGGLTGADGGGPRQAILGGLATALPIAGMFGGPAMMGVGMAAGAAIGALDQYLEKCAEQPTGPSLEYVQKNYRGLFQ